MALRREVIGVANTSTRRASWNLCICHFHTFVCPWLSVSRQSLEQCGQCRGDKSQEKQFV